MATSFGGSSKDQKGKKPHKNKPTSKKYKKYTLSGNSSKKGKICPRCGPGIFLAVHKDRLYCGKCHYTEFSAKAK
ncbi:MAG TPA: 30S ribosomal protein S27ae [Candidatus Nanoarchaeia archaeon]|nr:30S ribosomal protein S27ae [Candidatus Nanoarchaeia archaeon]